MHFCETCNLRILWFVITKKRKKWKDPAGASFFGFLTLFSCCYSRQFVFADSAVVGNFYWRITIASISIIRTMGTAIICFPTSVPVLV
jgi:hypothetical protein